MNVAEFVAKLQKSINLGDVFVNPGGGTSTILKITDGTIRYKRGKSSFAVKFKKLYDAYARFAGGSVSTLDLKQYAPDVFDSNARPAGHNCNCTLLFLLLQRMSLVGQIEGAGKKGDPFRAVIA